MGSELRNIHKNNAMHINLGETYAEAAFVGPRGLAYFFHGPSVDHTLPPSDQVSLYIPDFFLQLENPWKTFTKVQRTTFAAKPQSIQRVELPVTPYPKEDFSTDFELVASLIKSGQLDKAVPFILTHFERRQITKEIRQQMFSNLIQFASESRALCFLNFESDGLIGLSPELLCRVDLAHQTLTTVALAGTAKGLEAKQLLEDPKERKEHDLVIEGIVSAIADFGEVEVGQTQVAVAGTLQHLKTNISCRLSKPVTNPSGFSKIIERLHPTPALGLKSKSLDFQWLKNLRSANQRKRFGAPFAIWDPELGGVAHVAIRNLQWDSTTAFVATGCGVVAESDFENEWSEVQRKLNSVLTDLGVLP